MMIPPGALAALLQNMPAGMNKAAMPAAAMPEQPGAPGQAELAGQDMRRERIKGAMMEAKAGFDAGLEATPAPTPVTGPQPPQAQAPTGGMTGGAFPQRVTPEMARMQGGPDFPMSRGFRGGFPKFGGGGY